MGSALSIPGLGPEDLISKDTQGEGVEVTEAQVASLKLI
jgi:hypothetical protein